MKKNITNIAAGVAAGLFVTAQASAGGPPSWVKPGDSYVKCAGIAAKGKNDCGAVLNGKKLHSCGGKAVAHNLDHEWVYVPKGVCEKITGGKVLATKTLAKK